MKKTRKALRGEITPPADKSISHRAAIFASIARGKSVIRNYLRAGDTASTLRALRALGIQPRFSNGNLTIEGRGLYGFREPSDVINCGNSGTTIRLFAGLLAGGNPFFSVLTGDASLRARPMGRVILPLTKMGARIRARSDDNYPPLAVKGEKLRGISYPMPVASAQLKSSLLIAGLYAEGETTVTGPGPSRDHTERMLSYMGARINVRGNSVSITGQRELGNPLGEFTVPGDFSSAAFFIVGALIAPGSEISIKSVGMNPGRTGLLNVLERMGASITIENRQVLTGEPVADLRVKYRGRLRATVIEKKEIPALIDEVPILSVAAAAAEGTTVIKGARELRVKESDRLKAMAGGLKALGLEVEEHPDGLSITGKRDWAGNGNVHVESFGDHRVAMSFSIAALLAGGVLQVEGASSAAISYPGFFETLSRLMKG